MNLFEKIFNYQILSRLGDSGTFMVTSHERAWLKTMLAHPAADEAFTTDTLAKLRSLLETDEVMDLSGHLTEKARSQEKQVYHPLLRSLRRHLMNNTGIRITYETKSGRVNSEHAGLPYKLEYSMVKREWYLLWYRMDGDDQHSSRQRPAHAFMSTRLSMIRTVTPESIEPSKAERVRQEIEQLLHSQRSEAVIEIVRAYNAELSRILYAFSSFEKTVEYEEETDLYRVRVVMQESEREYLLSKLRFLGMRVRVVEGDFLKRRMLETSGKALERYGVVKEEAELSS
ncbi:WYL domain-containing protein [Paenibacillus sp. YYML68]|uniref:WYL domain-containing protein n=1 Tax=Paenibacillus sp. YYML68 TaxID=2909250 RepID=UPI002491328B|nr:WYL domain-containing protein [Paenibacillus sp. YYML68]